MVPQSQPATHATPTATPFQRVAATPPPGLSWAQVNLFFSEVLLLGDSPLLEADSVNISDLPFDWQPDNKLGPSTNCGGVTGDDDGGD